MKERRKEGRRKIRINGGYGKGGRMKRCGEEEHENKVKEEEGRVNEEVKQRQGRGMRERRWRG